MSNVNFGLYASYYNLLYKDKDYKTEIAYIESLVKKYTSDPVSSFLDLGCGTGNHDFLLMDKGYCVTGVDLSIDMIKIAEKKNKSGNYNGKFLQGNIQNLRLNKKFDAVLALFHVMSYQTSNEEVLQSMLTAKRHLKKNGLFLFDCWYGPAVLSDPPVVREKKLEDEKIIVKRLAIPEIHYNENIVDVNYELSIEDKKNGKKHLISEKHPMRYFFNPELKFYAQQAGFTILNSFEWLTTENPLNKSWYVVNILKSI